MQYLSWYAILTALHQQRSFFQLQRYIAANPIPQLANAADDTSTQSETNILDLVALHHIPEDTDPNFAPVQIEGDGNCFPHTISYLLSKTQDRHMEIRVHIIYETFMNMGQYLDDNYVLNGAHNFYDRGTSPAEVLDICSDGTFMGI